MSLGCSRGGAGGLQQGHEQVGSRAHVVIQAAVQDVGQGRQQTIPPAQPQHLHIASS